MAMKFPTPIQYLIGYSYIMQVAEQTALITHTHLTEVLYVFTTSRLSLKY